MTSEHYLREIAELMKEMNQRLARIEANLGAFPKLKSPIVGGEPNWIKEDLAHHEIPR